MTLGQIVLFGFLAVASIMFSVGSYESKHKNKNTDDR